MRDCLIRVSTFVIGTSVGIYDIGAPHGLDAAVITAIPILNLTLVLIHLLVLGRATTSDAVVFIRHVLLLSTPSLVLFLVLLLHYLAQVRIVDPGLVLHLRTF